MGCGRRSTTPRSTVQHLVFVHISLLSCFVFRYQNRIGVRVIESVLLVWTPPGVPGGPAQPLYLYLYVDSRHGGP